MNGYDIVTYVFPIRGKVEVCNGFCLVSEMQCTVSRAMVILVFSVPLDGNGNTMDFNSAKMGKRERCWKQLSDSGCLPGGLLLIAWL